MVEQLFYASDKLLGRANDAVAGRKLQSTSARRSRNHRKPGGKVVEHFQISAGAGEHGVQRDVRSMVKGEPLLGRDGSQPDDILRRTRAAAKPGTNP